MKRLGTHNVLDIRSLSLHTQIMERKSIYVESTIPSYLTARVSSDFLVAAHQSITRTVWDNEIYKYDLFISDYVIEDCEKGDSHAAKRRLDCIAGITILQKTPEIESLALVYQKLLGIPDKAKEDCFHLAACVVERIDYLLTWNCRHLGAIAQRTIQSYNDKHGLWTPALITPEHLLTEEVTE